MAYCWLYVGGAGSLVVRPWDQRTVTFGAVNAWTLLPLRCDRVLATGATATNMVALV
ncbi:spike base protein, RCAP_Rcc01079 family [Phreatobacter oligotrophus]|uniref:spike base protein, RCAP_Rcc01079 family n=1 Tax=Phreatobacter oligotrophus TaxID=1122261 RepID=UPI001473C0FC|nr:hypothetical protein [Phreatobacter oligotrophus]